MQEPPITNFDKRDAARELCECAKKGKPIDVIARVIRLHHEEDAQTKSYLIEAASFLVTSKHGRSVIPVLANCMESADFTHRQYAVAGFERYVENGGEISQYLELLLKRMRFDMSPNIRTAASQILVKYAQQEEAHAITILNMLPDTDSNGIGVLRSFCLDNAPSKRKARIESLVAQLSDKSNDTVLSAMNELDWYIISGAKEIVLEAVESSEIPFELAKDIRQRCNSV